MLVILPGEPENKIICKNELAANFFFSKWGWEKFQCCKVLSKIPWNNVFKLSTFFRSLQQGSPRPDQGHLACVRPLQGVLPDCHQPYDTQRPEASGFNLTNPVEHLNFQRAEMLVNWLFLFVNFSSLESPDGPKFYFPWTTRGPF